MCKVVVCSRARGALLLGVLAIWASLGGASFCDWSPRPDSPDNNVPLHVETSPKFVRSVPNGLLYTAGDQDPFDIVHLYGTPYQMGVAHGQLQKTAIQQLIPSLYEHFNASWPHLDVSNSTAALIHKYGLSGALDMVHTWTAPYTAPDVYEELRGLADGSGVDYQLLVRLHLFPELVQAACSYIGAYGPATKDGNTLHVRALDWDTTAGLQKHPQMLVYHSGSPTRRAAADLNTYSVLTWTGFIGVLTGVSSAQLSFADIGVGYPDGSFGQLKRQGTPWLYMAREILQHDQSLTDVTNRLKGLRRTTRLLVGVASGTEKRALGYQYSTAVLNEFTWSTLLPNSAWHPRLNSVVWWAMDWNCPTFDKVMAKELQEHHGNYTALTFMRQVLPHVNTGNLHIQITDFAAKQVYVSNARGNGPKGTGSDAYQRQFTRLDIPPLFAQQWHS